MHGSTVETDQKNCLLFLAEMNHSSCMVLQLKLTKKIKIFFLVEMAK